MTSATNCPHCGETLTPNAEYCDACGVALRDGAPEGKSDAETTEREETASPTQNDVNPFAIGSQTTSWTDVYESEPRDVPSDMIEAIKLCFRGGGVVGRSSRPEFWYWSLLVFATVVFPIGVGVAILAFGDVPPALVLDSPIPFVVLCWGILLSGSTFSVAVRRLHDVGLSGGLAYALLLWFSLLPIVLWLGYFDVLFFRFFFQNYFFWGYFVCATLLLLSILGVALFPGTAGKNRYGPKPERRRKDSSKSKSLDDSLTPKNNEASR